LRKTFGQRRANPKASAIQLAFVPSAECKGGIAIGLLMANQSPGRQIAVVPRTSGTLRLARRLAPRCSAAGIDIALAGRLAEVQEVRANG
jgi:hypothetical protein